MVQLVMVILLEAWSSRKLSRVSSKSYTSGQISCLLLNFASAVARMDLTLLHSANISMMRWVAIGTCPATIIRDSISVMVIAESLWVSIAGQLSTKVTRQHQHLIRCLQRHPARHTQLSAAVFLAWHPRARRPHRLSRRRVLLPPALPVPGRLAVRVRHAHQTLPRAPASHAVELLSASSAL